MVQKEVILIGYSGHGLVVAEAAVSQNLNLLFYSEVKERSRNPFNLKYLGNENDKDFRGWDPSYAFILGIGDNGIRAKISKLILGNNQELLNVIHPSAQVSETVKMGMGNFIAKNISVNPLATIGNSCIINTGSIVEHECEIGDYVHIAPGAVLAGNVKVGNFSFIGANAVVKQGICIGSNAVIGAGAVVLRDVQDNQVIVGNPGKEL